MAMTTYSADQIVAIVEKRRRDRAPVIEVMRQVKSVYNTDIVIPLPEMDEMDKPYVPNLILTGIDQHATRISSVTPIVKCPPRDPESSRSRKYADNRRGAILGWWENSSVDLGDAQRARWFVGYGAAPVIIRPDFGEGVPVWEYRDPLDAYPPPPTGNPGKDLSPRDCAFVHRHQYRWLRANYPREAARLTNGRNPADVDPSEQFEVIEWFDEDRTMLIGLANQVRDPYTARYPSGPSGPSYLELGSAAENPTGLCPVVFPGRVTLDRPRGQFDQAIGMYYAHSKLMALGMIAVERDVFQDMFLVSRDPNEDPQFLEGPYDGRTGQWNRVKGIPQGLNQPPGPLTTQFMDRVENSSRITAGIPTEYGGESNTNIRTGRRGQDVREAVIYFPIAEAQKILARARREENRRAIAIAKAFFGNREKTLFVEAVNRSVTYLPDRDFDTDINSVSYPIAGADANNLTIEIGQMTGVGMMSKRTGMELHPHIADAEHEYDQVTAEGLESALLAAIQQGAIGGTIPPADIAKLIELVRSDRKELAPALQQVHKEAQERQASSGEPGTPTGPVPPGSPEAQPGLAQPGAGAEQPTAAAGEPNFQEFLQMIGG